MVATFGPRLVVARRGRGVGRRWRGRGVVIIRHRHVGVAVRRRRVRAVVARSRHRLDGVVLGRRGLRRRRLVAASGGVDSSPVDGSDSIATTGGDSWTGSVGVAAGGDAVADCTGAPPVSVSDAVAARPRALRRTDATGANTAFRPRAQS